jgi:16S rRNA (uracil1498-N3)-methyltransferase
MTRLEQEGGTLSRTDAALATRLYLEAELAGPDSRIELSSDQVHFLGRVLRLEAGRELALFNGRDGEWRARIGELGKRAGWLELVALERPQPPKVRGPVLVMPMIRKQRLETLLEKVTELGVAVIQPVLTDYANAREGNMDRWHRIMVEAAEQCERLTLPEVLPQRPLSEVLAGWDVTMPLLYGALSGRETPTIAAVLAGVGQASASALLVGPEGGLSQAELDALGNLPFAHPVLLGPHVLRAETAAIAGLAQIQAAVISAGN